MNKYHFLFGTFLASTLLTSCVPSNADTDTIGFASVVYEVNKIGPNKYTLEATTANGVTNDELLAKYKARATRLCQPKQPNLNYKISTDTYMGTFNAMMKLPMTAPKITGIVICK